VNAEAAAPVPEIRVDLYSDTVTRPTAEMRAFMMSAEVGDEQKGEDPTTNLLADLVKDLLGKEAAVFLPSGTMCNEIAVAIHCRPGDEMIMDRTAHLLTSEAGGPAALSGVLIHPLAGQNGVYTSEQVVEAIRPATRYAPRSAAMSVEQTSNHGGGTCWPLDTIASVTGVARENGLATHMDGARLWNASVATGVALRDYAEHFDSVFVDLSKGLGAPIGGLLAGSEAFIHEAWRLKQRWGGSLRQSGIVAAAGVYALKNNIDRLADDHANAQLIGDAIAQHRLVRLRHDVATNIVIFDIEHDDISASGLAGRLLADHGVRVSVLGERTVRLVTHLDVDREDVRYAADALLATLDQLATR
jgi:threonine aldolase